MSSGVAHPVLCATGLTKTFDGQKVLDSVDLSVHRGEVHGLLGQNGSGKSTLVKILCGYHEPDPGGALSVNGVALELPLRPGASRFAGMAFVHQDLGLAPRMTVLENLRIGRFRTRLGWRIDWRAERRAATSLLTRYGVAASPDDLVASLREVDRALLAIVRALEDLPHLDGLLVLDESTAYLPRDGVEQLFDTIRSIAAAGTGVLLVTHRLEEIREITDRVTVLRDGACVGDAPTASLNDRSLMTMILGCSRDELGPEPAAARGEVVFEAAHVSGSRVEDFHVTIRAGEVVGVTGLLGAGWETVPYLLFGAEPAASGWCITRRGRQSLVGLIPRRAIECGIALLPADRLRDGGLATASVLENLTLATLPDYFSAGRLHRRRERERVTAIVEAFDIRPPDHGRAFGTLSGGNQQKVVVGKWLETRPSVLLLHDPVRGVDVGARAQIFRVIREAAEAGTGILVAAGEYEDLIQLCDRVIVFRKGRAASELRGGSLTLKRLSQEALSGS